MLFEFIVEWIVAFIAATSYFGVFFLMVLESMVFPVPSEAVVPFAGFLVEQGQMAFALAALAATMGSVVGSLISYYIGLFGGKRFVKKFGKYFLLNQRHLKQSERFFKKHGSITIFISRFIPAVRHVISIPAGAARMHLGKFVALTFFGALGWNSFLLYVGVLLKQNWKEIMDYTGVIDIVIVIAVVVGVFWLLYRHTKK